MSFKNICLALHAFLTPAPSVDAIVADLDRTLGKLDAAERKLQDRAALAEKKAAALVQSAVKCRIHAGRARRVATRISGIIE
ncbi:hypothetical protein [Xanthomonas tesorieronis]|uniref:hypothetical protein n=1 Tax=Xanthomonas tesorieronis TaxID=3160839 RepID=UPI003515F43F